MFFNSAIKITVSKRKLSSDDVIICVSSGGFFDRTKKIFDRFSRPLNSESRFRIGIGKSK